MSEDLNGPARAARTSAVSGAGLMLIAMIAVAAMTIAADIDPLRERLIVWIGAAFVAPVVYGLATRCKAGRNQLLLIGDRGRRFLFSLAPDLKPLRHRPRTLFPSTAAVSQIPSLTEPGRWLDATDGNLGVRASMQRNARYVSCEKAFEGRAPGIDCDITVVGRKALPPRRTPASVNPGKVCLRARWDAVDQRTMAPGAVE